MKQLKTIAFLLLFTFPVITTSRTFSPGSNLSFGPALLFAQDGWVPLFNGENLDGWRQLGGEAEYEATVMNVSGSSSASTNHSGNSMEGNAIIGRAVPNSPNSFLVTEQTYGDFIVEFDVYMNTQMNSGVQIRSESYTEYNNGRVHGYQVELDPGARAWTGGIYDEARRGWLYPLVRDEARSAFRLAEWNTVRIEAIGNTILTWVNGIQTAHLVDDMTSEGFIGLQVHSINNEALLGAEVIWRNLRIMTDNLEEHRRAPDPEVRQISYLVNELTDREVRRGWRLLWDGETPAGWRGARMEGFPEQGWEMEEGALTIRGSTPGVSRPGDIVTRDLFTDFELELEFRITEAANSGIKYFVNPELLARTGEAIGLEFQVLDDENHPDATQGVGGNRTVGSLYDMIAVDNLSVAGQGVPAVNPGNWNKARIVVRDGQVEHWLNNQKVVEYDRFSQMFRALVEYSKYNIYEGFGQGAAGPILLQDHNDEVSYRSIKVREL